MSLIEEQRNNVTMISSQDPALTIVCELLELDQQNISKWICNRQITTKFETIITPRSFEDSIGTRSF